MNYIVVVTRSNHLNKNYTRVNRIRFNIHVGCTCILSHEEVVSFIHTSLWMFLYDSVGNVMEKLSELIQDVNIAIYIFFNKVGVVVV